MSVSASSLGTDATTLGSSPGFWVGILAAAVATQGEIGPAAPAVDTGGIVRCGTSLGGAAAGAARLYGGGRRSCRGFCRFALAQQTACNP